jgi:hypothetical protein
MTMMMIIKEEIIWWVGSKSNFIRRKDESEFQDTPTVEKRRKEEKKKRRKEEKKKKKEDIKTNTIHYPSLSPPTWSNGASNDSASLFPSRHKHRTWSIESLDSHTRFRCAVLTSELPWYDHNPTDKEPCVSGKPPSVTAF